MIIIIIIFILMIFYPTFNYVKRLERLAENREKEISSLKRMHDVAIEQLKQVNEYLGKVRSTKILNCAYNFKVKHIEFLSMYGKEEIIVQVISVDEYETPQTIDEHGYESSMEIVKMQLLGVVPGATVTKEFDYDKEPENIDLVINMPMDISENLSLGD